MRMWIRVAGLVLISAGLLALAGCQGVAPARRPTLTPVLLPRETATPVRPARATADAASPTPRAPRPNLTTTPAGTNIVPASTGAIGSTPTAAPTGATPITPTASAPVTATTTLTGSAPVARAPTRAPATSTALGGTIVFQASAGGDIYLLSAVRGPAQKLTTGLDPALSPDGKQVAFARWGDAPGIYVRDLASGQERQVTGAGQPRSPSWSPDSSQLVFQHSLGSTVCRQSPFGCLAESDLRARFGGRDCIPSPLGQLCIADFPQVQIEKTGLVQVGADGQGWQDLPTLTDAQSPAWRPGSGDILHLGGGQLQITTAGGQPQPLAAEAWTLSPRWSPDGRWIVAQRRIHDRWEIVLLDAAGATVKQLTADRGNNVAPAWSPDGRTLLFLSDREGRWQFYRMNPDGSGQALFRPDALMNIELRYDFAGERVANWGP